jgi:hypothetical protein
MPADVALLRIVIEEGNRNRALRDSQLLPCRAGESHTKGITVNSRGEQGPANNEVPIPEELLRLAASLAALKEQAQALGLFVGDRDLLECTTCGLLEDVAFSGELITCKPSQEGQDTGLRFAEVSANRFRCPACGAIVSATDPSAGEQAP